MTSALTAAAWRGISPTTSPSSKLSPVRQRFLQAVAGQREHLLSADARGGAWRRGLCTAAEGLIADDARFAFIAALPRSALFGETVIAAASSDEADAETLNGGRLVNVLVTCLDGICDETPELLPATLPYLDRLIAALPGPLPDPPPWNHPVIGLTHDAAVTVARTLTSRTTTAEPALLTLVTQTISTAYRRQIETLQVPTAGSRRSHRTELSVATFAVTLLLAAVMRRLPARRAAALVAASGPLGAFFGWVDDLVDIEDDVRRGHPNLAAAVIGDQSTEPAVLTRVTDETLRRWVALAELPEQLASQGVEVADDLERRLRDAAYAWLGFPASAPD